MVIHIKEIYTKKYYNKASLFPYAYFYFKLWNVIKNTQYQDNWEGKTAWKRKFGVLLHSVFVKLDIFSCGITEAKDCDTFSGKLVLYLLPIWKRVVFLFKLEFSELQSIETLKTHLITEEYDSGDTENQIRLKSVQDILPY